MEDKNNVPEEEVTNVDKTQDDVQGEKAPELQEDLESAEESTADISQEVADSESSEEQKASAESKQEAEVQEAPKEIEAQAEEKEEAVPETESVAETEGEKEEEHEEEHEEQVDFSQFSKQELAEYLVSIKNEENMRKVDGVLKEIRPFFDEIFLAERSSALERYMSSTEEADEADFEYKGDEWDQKFNDYYDLLKSRRNDYYSNLEKSKESNLLKKQSILDKIRELVDGEETNVSINSMKDLQDEWKSIGPVPSIHNKTLWANYNALLDRYYDARSIYFELKELDRKKNLESKKEIVAKAESLNDYPEVRDAIKELNDLHEEFKHIGPVPKEEQEPLWLRFKAASDRIYEKRKEYTEKLKGELNENLVKKSELGDQIHEFSEFASDRINEWNAKTKEILDLQKKWEAIGGLPRDRAKEINRKFWNSFKKFFSNKNAFFKTLESQREDNLKKKQELVAEANTLKESTEWDSTADKLKRLQSQWREIGPVPEKFRNEVYQEFKAACDHFFDQKRSQNQEQNKEFEKNLTQKMELCDKLEELSKGDSVDQDAVYDIVDEYMELGFVPRNAIKKSKLRFDEVTKKLLNHASLSEEEKNELRINIQVNKLKGSPHGNRKLQRKENALRRKISSLENDIVTWKNNMEFFAASKKADALRTEFNEKIDSAKTELDELKKQLKILHHS